jgi:hypothetical protein
MNATLGQIKLRNSFS